MHRTILITGASGKLGKRLVAADWGPNTLLTPTHSEMDITNKASVDDYVRNHLFDAVVHCAALTNMNECESNPPKAIALNVRGTSYIVEAVLKHNPTTRLLYLSTDYVYPCIHGLYKESDPTIPFTVYAWTKLGGECVVKSAKNHVIIRTSFFDPAAIPFDSAPDDAYASRLPVETVVAAVKALVDAVFVGTVNVGRERASLYTIFREFKPALQKTTLEEVNRNLSLKRACDSSLDITLWKKLALLEKVHGP